ncbi:MAG TPA: threonine/serine exporter family protein [Chthoniobacter sp.]|nr:threonine/serine exporter family protein [Chthoniobacter sp.]
MNTLLIQIIHQGFFGGVAAAGFAVLFNYRPSLLPLSFGAGLLALATRTAFLESGFTLPIASFFGALAVAIADRLWKDSRPVRGAVLAIVGAIPMVPGGIAAKVLITLFVMLGSDSTAIIAALPEALQGMMTLTFTIAAIGTGLALPSLFQPWTQRTREQEE